MAKNSNDKYYTPPEVVKKVMEVLKRYFPKAKEIIEPSAGDGAFIPAIKETGIPYAFYDLYPEHPEIEKMDFKELKLGYRPGRIFVGNPPFGNASSLFKRFVKGACEMGDGAVYVGPASHWNAKWGWKGLRLVYSEHLGNVEYYTSEGNGEAKKVNTCLNVYMRGEEDKDDRMERLDRDVEITYFRLPETIRDGYDFIVPAWGKRMGKMQEKSDVKDSGTIGIKILNEDRRKDIEGFFKIFKRDDVKDLCASGNYIKKEWLKQKLAEWLYPTREERLDRDVEIIGIAKQNDGAYSKDIDGDFYMVKIGDAGRIDKEPKGCRYEVIKILNEDRRDDIEKFFYSIKNNIKKYESVGVPGINKGILKQKLAEWLYPEDEYGDSFYNEKIRGPQIPKPYAITT